MIHTVVMPIGEKSEDKKFQPFFVGMEVNNIGDAISLFHITNLKDILMKALIAEAYIEAEDNFLKSSYKDVLEEFAEYGKMGGDIFADGLNFKIEQHIKGEEC